MEAGNGEMRLPANGSNGDAAQSACVRHEYSGEAGARELSRWFDSRPIDPLGLKLEIEPVLLGDTRISRIDTSSMLINDLKLPSLTRYRHFMLMLDGALEVTNPLDPPLTLRAQQFASLGGRGAFDLRTPGQASLLVISIPRTRLGSAPEPVEEDVLQVDPDSRLLHPAIDFITDLYEQATTSDAALVLREAAERILIEIIRALQFEPVAHEGAEPR